MHEQRHCRQCGEQMEYRLGNFECVCGFNEAAVLAPDPVQQRRVGIDPGLAYRKLQEEPSHLAQLDSSHIADKPKYGQQSVPLVLEKSLMLAVVLAGTAWMLFAFKTIQRHMEYFYKTVDVSGIPAHDEILFGWLVIALAVHLCFTGVAMFNNTLWMKWVVIIPPFVISVVILVAMLASIVTPTVKFYDAAISWWALYALALCALQTAVLSHDLQATASPD